MDALKIQSKVWRGYGKVAKVVGTPYKFYRPKPGELDWSAPGGLKHLLFSRNVSLNAEDMKYAKPNKYGKPTWYAVFDGTDIQPGDYFIGSQGTFFVVAMQLHLPILVIGCNATISIARAPQHPFGQSAYSSLVDKEPYVSGIPCGIMQGTKGEKSEANLPADTRTPWWTIFLPKNAGDIRYGDAITDDRGFNYVVSSSELTDLGYRLTAMQTIV